MLTKLLRIGSVRRLTTDVRVRFAPSPTGHMHLGGLRTALYNYLFAKSQNGTFILRIEDTDRTRIVPGAVESLITDLKWVGLTPDEGPTIGGNYGPYLQSERLNIYQKQVNKLLNNNTAYHCFCTDRRLDMIRREALKLRQVPKYDNKCRNLTKEEVKNKLSNGLKPCIRFKLTNDLEVFEDLIYGNISYDALNEGDPVIIKADGFPTYHFANVVDDHLMEVSHVLRGVEWQISTTKHILIYKAFGWIPPKFGHLPLLLNSDGTKMSKRQGDLRIQSFRDNGIFPQALINFVTHAGGGFNRDSGLKAFTIDELIDLFEINRINSNSTRLNPDRLIDFNRLELISKINNPEELISLTNEVKQLVLDKYSNETNLQLDDIETILKWSKTRINKISDLVNPKLAFLWIKPDLTKCLYDARLLDIVECLKVLFENNDWQHKDLKPVFKDFAAEKQITFVELMKFLRLILSGLEKGPSVVEIIEILGKTRTISRLNSYINYVNKLK